MVTQRVVQDKLEQFESRMKNWVLETIDGKFDEFEQQQIYITYLGLRREFAGILTDLHEIEEDAKKNSEIQPACNDPADDNCKEFYFGQLCDGYLTHEQIVDFQRRLSNLVVDMERESPKILNNEAYRNEILEIFFNWVTFHMIILRELQHSDPNNSNTFNEQRRIDRALKEYLTAARLISVRVLEQIIDPDRIERKDKVWIGCRF